MPCAALLTGLLHPLGFTILLAWPLQVLRLIPHLGAEGALFSVLGKLPEAQGVLGYWLGRVRRTPTGMIESE